MAAEAKRKAFDDCLAGQSSSSIGILHLSDLHFSERSEPGTVLAWLVDDLRRSENLGGNNLEVVVISGDVTDRGSIPGFEQARQFVSALIDEFRLSAQRCIVVPGNHDALDFEDSYRWFVNEEMALRFESDEERWHREGSVIFARDPGSYRLRFKAFSDTFYHKITQRPYPLDFEQQGEQLFPESRLQFLTLNSAWEVDQFNRKRKGILASSVARVIQEADRQVAAAIADGTLTDRAKVLRIGVWHHAVSGPEMIQNVSFLEHLQRSGVRICLHGDVHELRRDLVGNFINERMNVIGAGSLGASSIQRPESVPRLYNLLSVRRDLSSVRVHTRCQRTAEGAWKGWNEWPKSKGSEEFVSYFDVDLS